MLHQRCGKNLNKHTEPLAKIIILMCYVITLNICIIKYILILFNVFCSAVKSVAFR